MSGPVYISSDEFTQFLAQKKERERLRAALEEIEAYMEHRYQGRPRNQARIKIKGIVSKALNPDKE